MTLPEYADFKRDRWSRPLIVPRGGGKPVPYKRCTSYVGVLEDRYNLELWMKRMTLLGAAEREDLRISALAHKDDKAHLNRLAEQAMDAAKASSAATVGTAYHALTDLLDRGGSLPDGLPDEVVKAMDAYQKATVDLKVIEIEHPVVMDNLGVAGTPDRIVEYKGERYIADTKTGTIEFGTLKIAMQLAVYARSALYDVETGERTIHGCSANRGIIYHLPAGTGRAELRWIDLEAGWYAVLAAREVWKQRLCKDCTAKGNSTCRHMYDVLTAPFETPARPSLHQEKKDQARAEELAQGTHDRLAARIRGCQTDGEVRALWAEHAAEWTEALTKVAKAHIAGLAVAS